MLWSAVGHVCVSSHSCVLLKYIWHLIRFTLSVSRCHTMANLIVLVKLKGVISCLNPERCVPVQHTFTAVMFSFEHHQWPLIPPAFAVLFYSKIGQKLPRHFQQQSCFFQWRIKICLLTRLESSCLHRTLLLLADEGWWHALYLL